jgi:hypothetical protein
MTQSQSTFGTIAAITRLTHKALQSTNYRQLQRLEREVQALEADLSAASLPTDVWFDIPPNEWWNAN